MTRSAGPALGAALSLSWLGVLALLLLGLALTYPLSHDEQQYVAGARLAFDSWIYRDFMYIQTPYWALVLGSVMELVGDRPFLVARLTNWVVSSASVATLFVIARQAGASRFVALGAATLFASSSVVAFSFGTARNDILPMLFALLGCYFYMRASSATPRGRAVQTLVAGVMLAAAVGSKISFAFAPLGIVAFSLARQSRERRHDYWSTEFAPLAAGGILGAVPMIALALPSLANFWYGVVQYHGTATLEWYAPYNSEQLTLLYQLQLFVRLFLHSDATLAASIWLVAIAGLVLITPSRTPPSENRWLGLLPLALLAVCLPFAFMPRPSWVQYFAPLVPFLILAPIFLSRLLPEADARRSQPLTLAIVVLGSLSGIGNMAVDATRALARPGSTTIAEVQALGREIDAALGARTGAVLTLGPIYVLEGGRPIAAELAMGPQFFRTGDSLDAATIERLRGVTPATLDALVKRIRPAGILVGVDTVDRFRDVEAPLKTYAAEHGYTPVALAGPPAATLLVPPEH
jgi:hypothetical protein